MRKHLVQSNAKMMVFLVAVLTFVVTVFIALLPKSPTGPPELPNIVKQVASEVGGKYWWALVVGGLVAIWFDRRILWRLVLTLLLAQVVIEILKFTVGEMRPDGRFFNSFPSGHTASSFAYATIMSMHFRWGWLWFLFATVVGLSRIITNAHWWHDVVGGAALGYIIAAGVCELQLLARDKFTKPSSVPEQPKRPDSSEQSEIRGNQNAYRDE